MIRLFVLLTLCAVPDRVMLWSAEEVSTLKLLQIVHRHGDRTINRIYPNDPFKDMSTYWPEGLGELTTKGKHRMYKLGQLIRDHYRQYLGSEYSPREVYARSSAKNRCLESVSCLLAGMYPPNSSGWQWNNTEDSLLGSIWQPIPIETFTPMDDDRLLRTESYCPKCTEEMIAIERSDYVQNILQKERPFLDELSDRIGFEIKTTMDCKNIHDFLSVEYERGFKWSDHSQWSPDYQQMAIQRLLPLAELLWRTEWNHSLVQRTRAGPLISELVNNIKTVIDSGRTQSRHKVIVYSTHDAMIGVLLHSLQVFNNRIIPITAIMFFELHLNSNTNSYFVRIYYLNETLSQMSPHLLRLPKCDHLDDCPIDRFFALTRELIPEDWELECGITDLKPCFLLNPLTLSILIVNLILFLILIICLVIIFVGKQRKYLYQSLK